jgi:heme oxygenase (biliverdin-producing, ferredoxin)
MSLREITKDLHTDAERTEFAKKLLSGSISKEDYANYLYQMVLIYPTIEMGNKIQGNFANLPDIERAWPIYQDYIELAGKNNPNYKWLPSTVDYHHYLLELLNDLDRKHLIKAHLYCRHMGDLYGGQILAKRVPGQGKFYKFKDPERLKEQIRAELTDDLGDEARVAFEWAIKIMRELNNEPSLGHTN